MAQSQYANTNIFIRQKELLKKYAPISPATLWRLIKIGKFPPPIKITDQITAWRLLDVLEWVEDPKNYRAPI